MTVATKAQRIEVNVTDQHGMPCVNLPIHAIALARAGAIDELEATEITDSSGTCYFTIDEPCFFRPMLSQMFKRQVRVQILGVGSAGIMKHAVVDQLGFGTHTTITAAIAYVKTLADAGGDGFVIHVNPGTYSIGSAGTESGLVFDFAKGVVLEAQGSVSDLAAGDYNGVVIIRNPNSTGEAKPVVEAKSGVSLQIRGIYIDQAKVGENGVEMKDAGTELQIDESYVDGSYGSAVAIMSSSAMPVTAHHSVFTANNSSGAPTIGGISTVFYHFVECRVFGLPILKGDFGGVFFKHCILQGNGSYGSGYLIQEDNLVVSTSLGVEDCEITIGSRAAGAIYYGNASANISGPVRIVGNQFSGGANAKGIYLIYVDDALINSNRFSSFTGTGIGIEFDQQVRGVSCMGNIFTSCVTGIKNSNTALDTTSVIGPNTFRGCGTDMSGVYSAYTPTNVTTDRAYDANATTLDEVADVLGTLIADLQQRGILQ